MLKFIKNSDFDAYFVALMLLAIGIPVSRFVMSSTQFLLILIWLTDGISRVVISRFFEKSGVFKAIRLTISYFLTHCYRNIIHKISLFIKNRIAVVLASLFLLHVIGLITTSDFTYAYKDLRTKVPLLLLPLIMSSMPPLSTKKMYSLLVIFILTVLIATFISFNVYLKKEFADIRHISLFISPIRFGLSIVFSFFLLLVYLFRHKTLSFWLKIGMFLMMSWFVWFLVILESGVGLVAMVVILSSLILVKAFKISDIRWRTVLVVFCVAIPTFAFFYVRDIVQELSSTKKVDISSLETYSAGGEKYRHDTINFGVEDGKYVGLYMAETELAEAWNKRSKYDFMGYDQAGQLIQYTIIRYMTSIDLRKDAAGVAQLSENDIRLIERGIANVSYVTTPKIRTRISKIIMGYRQFADLNDPNGSSVMQRLEYIKASVLIIEDNFWLGVGTGDLPKEFNATYERMQTPLKKKWWWRSHNQYLSIFVAFGVFGFLWFLFTLFYPAYKARKYIRIEYTIFLIIILLSMLTEDTIESQDGVTLFVFFNTFFLLAYRPVEELQS